MNSREDWEVRVDPSVLRKLEKLPRRDAEKILEVIKLLPLDPYFGDIQKMKAEPNVWRRRIGSYRLFYQVRVQEKALLVFHLARRTSKTY